MSLVSHRGLTQYIGAGVVSGALFGSDDKRRLQGYGLSDEVFYHGRADEWVGYTVGITHGFMRYDCRDYISSGIKNYHYKGYYMGIKTGVPLRVPVDSLNHLRLFFMPYARFAITERMHSYWAALWEGHRYASFEAGVSFYGMYVKKNHCFYFGFLTNFLTVRNDFGKGVGLWAGFGFKPPGNSTERGHEKSF